MRFRKCSSCVSPHTNSSVTRTTNNNGPANFPVQQTSSQLKTFGRLSTTTNDESSNDPCALQAQQITTSGNQRYATMMKYDDCVSRYAVNRFLDPITERASVSDDKRQILHLIRTEGLKATVCACTPCTRVIVDNKSDFYRSSSHVDCTV